MAIVHTREVVLLGATTQTTTGNGVDMVVPQGFTSAIITLNGATVSGTTPTLNVFVQNKLGQAASTDTSGLLATGAAIYDDLLGFSQVTTSTTIRVFRIVGGGNSEAANKSSAITAGTAALGPIGGLWRVSWTISGTTPSFSFSVTAQMIP